VESLTRKLLTVICTHGHVDHAGGALGFDPIYLSEKDYELVKEQTTIDFRRGYMESSSPGSISLEDWKDEAVLKHKKRREKLCFNTRTEKKVVLKHKIMGSGLVKLETGLYNSGDRTNER
jgi:hydroxyacylglutathione hydrolase